MQPNEVHPGKEDRPLTTLLSDFTRELVTLVRQEVQLTKAELSEKASQAGSGIGSLAVGGAIILSGFLVLLYAAVVGLYQAMGSVAASYPWLPPLIIGLIVLIIGFALLQKGRSDLKAKNLVPSKAGESLRRDKEFIKEQIGNR